MRTDKIAQKKIAFIGLGHFGYAWLKHLDYKNDPKVSIHAYDINTDVLRSLRVTRKHTYLHPEITIQSSQIFFEEDIRLVMKDCDILLLAVSSEATRKVMQTIRPHINTPLTIINTSKALDVTTGKRLSQIIEEELHDTSYRYALLAGGTIAEDLFNEQPLGIDLASTDTDLLHILPPLLGSKNLHVSTTTDLTGVEYASAFKNVIAILAGMVRGMGYSYGTETYVISQAATEVENLVVAHLGGMATTFRMNSQCWGNDLWMSCTGATRNKKCGILLGQGMAVHTVLKQTTAEKRTIEGMTTISILHTLPHIHKYPFLWFLSQYIGQKTTSLDTLKNVLLSH